MILWSAFIIGLLGSLHCVGMCGPIVAALPRSESTRWKFVFDRLMYNSGRVVSYAVIGIVFGLIGKGLSVAGFQQVLSIATGVVIILAVFLPAHYSQRVINRIGFGKLYSALSRRWGVLFRSQNRLAFLGIGILNGFLPCGFVYVGVAGAVATGSAVSGAAYMALFGAGTIPIMMAVALAGKAVGPKLRQVFGRAIPVFAVMLALLFILRGMSLGIPFLSPKMSQNVATGEIESSCCGKER